MAPAINQSARRFQIPLCQCASDLRLMTFQKAGEQFAGDVRLIGKLRILDQLIAEANRRPVHLVVGAPCQLNVATPFEAGSVGRAMSFRA